MIETVRLRRSCPCGGTIAIEQRIDPGRISGPPEDCYPPEVLDETVEACVDCGRRDPAEDAIDAD